MAEVNDKEVMKWDGARGLADREKVATAWDIYLLGITIVIGGQAFSWNQALQHGFHSCLLGTVLMAIGYSCLVLCLAELTSTFPFSGKC